MGQPNWEKESPIGSGALWLDIVVVIEQEVPLAGS